MKEVLLLNHSSNTLREGLTKKGYIINILEQPYIKEDISKLYIGYFIIEIDDENIEDLGDLTDILSMSSIRVIGIVNEVTNKIRSFLIKLGITDVIISRDVNRIVNYINTIEKDNNTNCGNIIILDDVIPRLNILKKIIAGFRYEPIIINTIDKILGCLEQGNIQFILVNLGTDNFDINDFIKKSLLSTEIKRIPIIPYKDTVGEIFIHEMITGLNRLARVLLSSDELYRFLVNILFRKELLPKIEMLRKSFSDDNLSRFAKESLQRLYYSFGDDIFSMEDILNEDSFKKLSEIMNSINETIIKADGLRWLVSSQ